MNDWDGHISPLGDEEAQRIPAGVLCRIIKRDRKGRSYCNPRSPQPPSIKEFNPRIAEFPAGELTARIGGRRHGIFPDQAEWVRQLTNEELCRYRFDDPMSGYQINKSLPITGGHHRLNEIQQRVMAATLVAETPVRILSDD